MNKHHGCKCHTGHHGHTARGTHGCKCGAGYHRRFLTKAEIKERLEKYAENLELELEAVKEKLQELE
jgi:hypothetical protein